MIFGLGNLLAGQGTTASGVDNGDLKPGDKLAFVGFGAGLTWGAMVVEWTGPIPAKKQVHPEQYRFFARLRSIARRALRLIEGFFSRKEL